MRLHLLPLFLTLGIASAAAQGNISIRCPAPHQYVVTVDSATPNVPYVLMGKILLTDATWSVVATQNTDANGATAFSILENTSGTGFYLSVSQAQDSDADGIPDWWMLQYFGHATGQAGDNSLASASLLNDGISNLQKYIRGENLKVTPTADTQNLINLTVLTPTN